MKLYILGCGDAFGSGGRQQSSYLIDAEERLYLLDCGPTALLAMKRAGFEPARLKAILISHLHGDHFAGLPFFIIDYLYRCPRQEPLLVAGPPGTESTVRQLFNLMYGTGTTETELPLEFHVLHPQRPAQVAGLEVFPFRVPHQTQLVSLALKIGYRGKQLLFSGDSLWTESFIEQARGVDLFLCECSFYREQSGMHVNYQALQAALPRLQCRQLLLTHLGEEMLAHRQELAVRSAEDGMIVEF